MTLRKIPSLILVFLACACSYQKNEFFSRGTTYQIDDHERLVNNIFIKATDPYAITYEYKDVRVDEVAALAVRYCQDTYQKPAHLQSVTLHKNNSRLATFHCVDNLQSK